MAKVSVGKTLTGESVLKKLAINFVESYESGKEFKVRGMKKQMEMCFVEALTIHNLFYELELGTEEDFKEACKQVRKDLEIPIEEIPTVIFD